MFETDCNEMVSIKEQKPVQVVLMVHLPIEHKRMTNRKSTIKSNDKNQWLLSGAQGTIALVVMARIPRWGKVKVKQLALSINSINFDSD